MSCPEDHEAMEKTEEIFWATTEPTENGKSFMYDDDGTPLIEVRNCKKCKSSLGRIVSEEARRRLEET